jgi:hypothetical protein
MQSIFRFFIFAALFFMTLVAYAEQSVCLIKKSPAYINEPLAGKALPLIKKQLPAGEMHLVIKLSTDWYLLKDGVNELWVSKINIGNEKFCTSKSKKQATASKAADTATAMPKKKSSSSCPCGSGQVCIGPRGGRYCISPNGAKRYGV